MLGFIVCVAGLRNMEFGMSGYGLHFGIGGSLELGNSGFEVYD